MSCEYTFPKNKFSEESVIERLKICFDNGDYLEIKQREILDASIDFYDSLIFGEGGAYPVARSGFIKLKIQEGNAKMPKCFLYNQKEYKSKRKQYIENRLSCEGGIKCITLYNCNNWSNTVFGDIYATCEDEFLFLRFKENEHYGTYGSENHSIKLRNISKSMIRAIDIDFENCDGFEIYGDEIVDLQFNFEGCLNWNSNGYIRCVKNGYMVIKLNPDYNDSRSENVYLCKKGKKMTRYLESRMCQRRFDLTDICNLYITYDYYDYRGAIKETITMPTLSRSGKWTTVTNDDELDGYPPNDYYCYEDDDEYEDNFPYISGYAEKGSDGTIKIVFGKKPPETLKLGGYYEQYKNILYSSSEDEDEN